MKPADIREILGRLDAQLKSMEDKGLTLPVEVSDQTDSFCQGAENLLEFVLDLLGAASAPPAPEPAPRPAERVPSGLPETSVRQRGGGIPVLLVEDNLVNRKLAILILERIGCQVDVATNGQEGVERFQAGNYLAIFMDCQMPVMDGYEATRTIRRLEAGGSHHIPIIAVTANAMKGDREKCLNCGMDDYIPKPLRPDDLKEAVNQWCKVTVA